MILSGKKFLSSIFKTFATYFVIDIWSSTKLKLWVHTKSTLWQIVFVFKLWDFNSHLNQLIVS